MVAGPETQGNENANGHPWRFCRPCQVELLKAIREQRQQMDLKDEQQKYVGCVAKRYSKLNTNPFPLTFWCPEF